MLKRFWARCVILGLLAALSGGCGALSSISAQDAATAESTATGVALKAWTFRAVGKYDGADDDPMIKEPFWTFGRPADCGDLGDLCNKIVADAYVAQTPPHRVLALRGHKIECLMPASGANFASLERSAQQVYLGGPLRLYDIWPSDEHKPSHHFAANVGPGGVAWDCQRRSN